MAALLSTLTSVVQGACMPQTTGRDRVVYNFLFAPHRSEGMQCGHELHSLRRLEHKAVQFCSECHVLGFGCRNAGEEEVLGREANAAPKILSYNAVPRSIELCFCGLFYLPKNKVTLEKLTLKYRIRSLRHRHHRQARRPATTTTMLDVRAAPRLSQF